MPEIIEETTSKLSRRALFKKSGLITAGIVASKLDSGMVQASNETGSEKIYTPGEIVSHGSGGKTIFLTIDDGWDASNIERALAIAKKEKIRLTFFPVGTEVVENPEIYKRAVKEGHAIENHTWDHSDVTQLTNEELRKEILKQQEAVQKAVGKPYKQFFFRPPYGLGGLGPIDSKMLDVCRHLDYVVAMWNCESRAFEDGSTKKSAFAKVMETLTKGSIVVQHALDPDMEALPMIIHEAKKRGYKMETMRRGIRTFL